jgi:hypothetical protein
MKEEFKFKPNGTGLLVDIEELENAIYWQMEHDVTTYDRMLCDVFNIRSTKSRECERVHMGKMPISVAVKKFG